MNLVLIGAMGTGKTAVGEAVARALGWPFVDTDQRVEATTGRRVAELFHRDGEAVFRRLEAAAVQEAAALDGQVIATGGGAVLAQDNLRRLKDGGFMIWLRASPAGILARLDAQERAHRPLLEGAEPLRRLTQLLEEREAAYRAAADAVVDTDGRSQEEVVREVLGQWGVVETVEVSLGEQSYPILIGRGVLAHLGELLSGRVAARRLLVVSTPPVDELYGATAARSLAEAGFRVHRVSVPDGEASKSLEQLARLWDAALAAGCDRGSAFVALGGGVVGDLTGFAAATFLRGVPLVQVPTSLVAQVDASIGGKVGIDLPRGKNLAGAFHQPRAVVADTDTLATLPPDQRRAGLAEVVKHAVIADPDLFAYLERHAGELPELTGSDLPGLVAANCRIKARVVAADEREGGARAMLNFGHTVGHGLEAAGGYRLLSHGQAVAIGMVAVAELACRLGSFPRSEAERLVRLLTLLGLPVRIPALSRVDILAAMEYDKKRRAGRLTFVLPEAIGRVVLTAAVPEGLVTEVLTDLGAV